MLHVNLPDKADVVISAQADKETSDRIAAEFKKTIRRTTPVPIITETTRQKFLGNFVAFSLSSNSPEWDDRGASKSRKALADAMRPLVCGKDYYVHAIE